MVLDPQLLLGLPPIETEHEIASKDVILYALGVGAEELPFIYEPDLVPLPTIALVLAYPGYIWQRPEYRVDWRRNLHGESSVELHAPLPTSGTLRGVTTLGPIFDKGAEKGAIVYQTRRIYDASGRHLATVSNASFLRGDGGFGGSSEGQPKPHPLPERTPDIVDALPTAANQALIYRLSGDENPLHVDPEVARAAGFERPILHGLCSFGVVGRSLLAKLCDNRPAAVKRLGARFSNPVFPGETIRTEIWREGDGRASFRALVQERGVVALNHGYMEFA